MHPEIHWRLVADRQQQQAAQRMKQQQLYKQKLKRAYMAELSNQLKVKEQLKKREKSLETWQDKQLIKMNVQSHKKQIESQVFRDKIIQEKQKILENETEKIMNAKRQHQAYMKNIEKDIELRSHQAAQYAAALKKQQQMRKKEQLRKNYLDTIEYNKQYKAFSQRMEKDEEKNVLNEGQSRKMKDQFQRLMFYHNLRERAKVVDYGSHRYFEQNTNKTLLDKKKQQWNTYKDFLELQQNLKNDEQKSKQMKAYLQNKFRNELKLQMEENRLKNKLKAQEEVQFQRRNMHYSQQYNNRKVESQKEMEQQKKRQLGSFLRDQAIYNKKSLQKQREMREDQMKINLDILGKQNNSSLDTYEFDYHRKRQLSVLQKSLKSNLNQTIDQIQNTKLNYFANRGMNLIK